MKYDLSNNIGRTLLAFVATVILTTAAIAQNFSLEQIKGYPFPTELTASANTPRIAWVFNERGVRVPFAGGEPKVLAEADEKPLLMET